VGTHSFIYLKTGLYGVAILPDVNDSVSMWWKFDESTTGIIGANAILDNSTNGNTGTGSNSPTWGAGKLGQGCLTLASASSQSVYTANALAGIPNTQSAQTLMAWYSY
jgi:hypothetical protein